MPPLPSNSRISSCGNSAASSAGLGGTKPPEPTGDFTVGCCAGSAGTGFNWIGFDCARSAWAGGGVNGGDKGGGGSGGGLFDGSDSRCNPACIKHRGHIPAGEPAGILVPQTGQE